ncbi:putative secreted protein [Ixodes scapularis]
MTEGVLKELANRFLACVPASEAMQCLEGIPTHALTQELQKRIMAATLEHPTAKRFPATSTYVKHYLKLLIDKLESREVEVLGDLYVCYTELLGSVDSGPGFVTYVLIAHGRTVVHKGTKDGVNAHRCAGRFPVVAAAESQEEETSETAVRWF